MDILIEDEETIQIYSTVIHSIRVETHDICSELPILRSHKCNKYIRKAPPFHSLSDRFIMVVNAEHELWQTEPIVR